MGVSVEPRSRESVATEAADDPPYTISSDQFFEMIEAGVFPEEARVYLRDGRILEEMAKTPAHSVLGSLFATALVRRMPPGWNMFPEGDFRMDEWNTRLPDLAVIRAEDPRVFIARNQAPEAADIGLVIEIAVTSLAKDLGANLRRYAESKIPTYWVADFDGARILAHSEPRVVEGQGEYGKVETVVAGGTLPLVLDGREVARFTYEELMP